MKCLRLFSFIYFSTLDQHKRGWVTQDQFRAAIENGFDISLTDEQFNSFLDHVPLTKNGAIRFTDFMAQFDTRLVQQLLMMSRCLFDQRYYCLIIHLIVFTRIV